MRGGFWKAVVIHSSYRSIREVRSITLRGLRRAYIAARLMALWDDLVTPYYDGQIEILWAVREVRKHNHEASTS